MLGFSLGVAGSVLLSQKPQPTILSPNITSHYNSTGTGEANYQWGLPASAQAGHKLLMCYGRGAFNSAITASGTSQIWHGWLDRRSATSGEAAVWQFQNTTLTETDIANGYVVVPNVGTSMTAVGVLLTGVTTITPAFTPNSTTSTAPAVATAGVTRSASLAANSIVPPSMTASARSLALLWIMRGGGRRTISGPPGWTLVADIDTSVASAGRYPQHIYARYLEAGQSIGSQTISWTGAPDMSIDATALLLT